MTKTKQPPEAADTDGGELAGAIGSLTDEIRVLRDAIDELRSSIRWGLQNDHFRSPENPVVDQVETNHEQIDATVREACSEMSGQVSDAVREGVREELRDLKESMDQFSTDATWAARKIREKPTEELNELRETLQGEIVELRGSVEQFMSEMHDAVAQIHEAVGKQTQRTLFDPCVMGLPDSK